MADLKPYPEYKKAEVPWIGLIPEGWEVVRNKHFLKEFNVPSQKGDEDLLTVSQYTGITKRKDRLSDENDLLTTAKTLEGYKVVEKGSMVMNIMLAWNGSLGLSDYDGIVSPAYAVFRVNQEFVYPRFLHYLHRTKLYTGIFETESTGVIKSRLRLYPEKYLALHSVLPPIPEQRQISRFLDWKTSQINRFIKAKKRQIELLKEQKQVIINDAVTGKIDVRTGKPYPKYKDSGVEWLGKVPEQWALIRNKYLLVEKDDRSQKGDEDLLTVSQYSGITKRKDNINAEVEFITTAKTLVGYKKVEANDMVINIMLAWNGSLGISPYPGIVSPAYCVFKIINNQINPLFLHFLHRSIKFTEGFMTFSTGVIKSRLRLYPDRYFSLKTCLPQINVQEEIITWIFNKTKSIDTSISRIKKEIDLIIEYRNRIISDIVTGKIDVRGIEVPQIVEGIEESNFDEPVADHVEDVGTVEKDSEY